MRIWKGIGVLGEAAERIWRMRAFDCFVGIDWSGAKGLWQKGIKVALARPGDKAPVLQHGPGPNGRWSRTEIASWIGRIVNEQRALVGLDFAFGFPPVREIIGDVVLDWKYVEGVCGADANFYGGQFFRAPGTAHSCLVNSRWLPRLRYSAHYLRTTEFAAKNTRGATPQSIFNAYGAAQVGPSSISGMRMLSQLQKQHSRVISIWPFDDVDDRRSVIVEIFPRYFPLSRNVSPNLSDQATLNAALKAFQSEPTLVSPASEDEGDALLSAAALRALSTNVKLFELPDVSIRNEGWIFGVPLGGNA